MKKFCVISFPIQEAFNKPFFGLLTILNYFSSEVYYIINKDSKIIHNLNKVDKILYNPIFLKFYDGLPQRIIRYAYVHIKISLIVFYYRNSIDTLIFFMEGGAVFPIIIGKIFQKKTIRLIPSCIITKRNKLNFITRVVILLKSISDILSNNIIIYSSNLINEWHLEPYRHKILIAHEHFLDFDAFTVTTPFPDRPTLIGYIGRLSGEKGVQHFAQALPAILSHRLDLRALIGGDGQLKDSIASSLQQDGIAERVDLLGWISHDELPKHLNQLRLLVLPSYTEGLPNIMLEAMACGTPVLATPVGAVPDVIVDGKTGFIMENNTPECIAENVMRALEHPDLEQIAEAGRRFVEENFTFEKAVENWKSILKDIE